MIQLLNLYLSALNSSMPAVLLMICGIVVSALGIFPKENYGNLSSLAFKFGLPIRTIYTLASQKLTQQDWLIVLAIILTSFLAMAAIIPMLFLYKKEQRFLAFGAIMNILIVNNCVISGIPVFSGLYDQFLVQKYAYLQVLACFGFGLPPVFFTFELAVAMQQTEQKKSCLKMFTFCFVKTFKQPLIIGVLLGLVGQVIVQGFKLTIPRFAVNFFDQISYITAPFGLLMLGMFFLKNMTQSYQTMKKNKQDALLEENKDKVIDKNKQKENVVYIIVTIYIQLMRHLILPIAMAIICRLFKIADEEIVELSVGIYASPTAVFSFVLCDIYGFGASLAGFDAVVGVFTGLSVIPILQLFCRMLWGVGK